MCPVQSYSQESCAQAKGPARRLARLYPVTRLVPTLALLALISACSRGADEPPQADKVTASSALPVTADRPGGEEDGRAWRYTSVADCTMVHEQKDEMPYVEVRCEGPAGYALRISDFDARNDLTVVDPAGEATPLDLNRIGGGRFSSIGDTAEWRGPAGGPFVPDALIVRYNLADKTYPDPDTPYLLAIRLQPQPCVVAKIAPGPAQSTDARRAADDPGPCLEG